MATANGPIRTAADPAFRFELRPIVLPAGFEFQAESLTLWDKARATRSFLKFAPPGEANDVPKVEDVMTAERLAHSNLAKVEAISNDVVTAIEQIFKRVTKGGES